MTAQEQGNPPPRPREPQRKPYHKPSFRYERAFETTALTCGKTAPIQQPCITVRKNS